MWCLDVSGIVPDICGRVWESFPSSSWLLVMVIMEGVLSLCRVTVTLFGRLPGVPEGLQVFSVSQVHSWWGVCFVHM